VTPAAIAPHSQVEVLEPPCVDQHQVESLKGDAALEGAVIELYTPAVVTAAADAQLYGVRVLPALVAAMRPDAR